MTDTYKVELPSRVVELKINGTPIHIDPSKMHASWVAKCLAYGMRRLPNDTHSGLKGVVKYDSIVLMAEEMQSGHGAPMRIVGGGSTPTDPIGALAMKNAKQDLTAMFKQVTGKGKAIDFAMHEKVAPFFTVDEKEGRATWVNATVDKWIAKQAESGNRDYKAEAKATLEGDDKLVDELDF